MATAEGRTPYESIVAGGKFRKWFFRRNVPATPYDKPSTALRNNKPGVLTKFVDPAYRLMCTGAHKIFGVFRKRLPTPSAEINEEARMYTSKWMHLKFQLKRKNKNGKKEFSLRTQIRSPTTNIEKLPAEILSEIFIRLLAKQVYQMRCVCKTWNALLSESSFVKFHLHQSIHNNNDNILLFVPSIFSFINIPFIFIARPSRSPDVELKNFIKLPDNLFQVENKYEVIGFVNGLICFSYGVRVHIWNPSLCVVSTLPPCSLPKGFNQFRFGYDPKTDEYKVVKLTSLLDGTNMLPEVEVYSMKKGSWEVITARFPLNIKWVYDNDDVVYVDGRDGHIHWLCDTDLIGEVPKIVVFDLGKETFHEILLPDPLQHFENYVMGVLGGKLCVISCIERNEWEVWVMEENESWVKHHTFSYFKREITPYGFTSRCELLFKDDECFRLYDLISDKTKSFNIPGGGDDIFKIFEYVDSLVWVAPDKHDHEHKICSISKFQCG